MWSVAKALQVPLDESITHLDEIPYTISFVLRKRIQVDSLNELPKEKRPPEMMIWDGSAEEIDDWLERVYKRKDGDKSEIVINTSEIE